MSEFSRIAIGGIVQDVMKGRYHTPADEHGVRTVIHPETNINNVIDETGKTLKDILLENGAGTNAYVDQKIAELVGSAPETLDTLQELAEALDNNADIVDTLTASIGLKADTTYVDEQLALKANTADVYTKGEMDTTLAGKAAIADVYTRTVIDEQLALKADTTYVDAELAKVMTIDAVNTALALKADKTEVYTKTELDAIHATKVNTTDLTTALATKADVGASYTKAEADAIHATKVNTTDLTTALALKADKTYVDEQLALKANAADVYTKVETDAAIAASPKVKFGSAAVADAADVNPGDFYIQII